MKTKLALALIAGTMTVIAGMTLAHRSEARHSPAADIQVHGYAQQKVVYHVSETDGLTRHGYLMHTLGSAQNHINAVGVDQIDLRFVLQGDGLDLLLNARANPEMASQIDRLKAQGVKFLICRNTLIGRNLDLDDLYEAKAEDVVGAAVAEVAALQAKGFVYLKP